ncbi:MAG TPA: C13 family peptidase [Rhizomicrobium sp.]
MKIALALKYRLRWLCPVALLLAPCTHATGAPAPFSDWAGIVVAGDWHAHDGAPSDIFDNARRDVARELMSLGFSSSNIEQFSARPGRSGEKVGVQEIGNALWDLSNRTSGGCLLYLTSHGSPDGMVLGETILQPAQLTRIVKNSCGERPTVVIVSACFSGIFVPALAAANRLILTAARADRTSFGCGQTDRYSYFDECVLSAWSHTASFPALGRQAQACVSAREAKEHVGPPSEPQMSIGADFDAEMPAWP